MSLRDLDANPVPGVDAVVDPAATGAVGPGAMPVAAPLPRTRGFVVGGLLVVAGLVAGWLGASPPGSLAMVGRVALVLAGVVLVYRGVAHLLRAALGPTVDPGLVLGITWLGLVLAGAALAPILPLGEERDTSATLLNPPFGRPDLLGEHPLGTNNFGLDELSRVVHGARASLTVALVAVVVGIVVGGAVGVVAGYRRGPVDRTVGILNNTMLAFPPLVLLLALSSVLDPSVRTLTIGLSILSIPINVRLARAATLQLAQREYVQAARAMGATRRRILVRELVPNVLPTLVAYGMIVVAVMIVAEASLSFLGLGIKQPEPSWGNMIAEGQQGIFEANPHIVLVPGVVLFLTVFSCNLVGEKLHARWDPQRRRL